MELFKGRHNAHGRSIVGEFDPSKGKRKAKCDTIKEDVTLEKWQAHLTTDTGIGIIPIREDSTCSWGAIDIDEYKLDHAKLMKKIKDRKLPLYVAKSKSGGAHCYFFTEVPITASKMREILSKFSAKLGLADKTEIFPKQTTIDPSSLALGNWINMPYQNGDRPFIDDMAQELSVEQFLEMVKPLGMMETLQLIGTNGIENDVYDDDRHEIVRGLPPCILNELDANDGKLTEGGRNNWLMHIGVCLRKKYPKNWADKLKDFNKELTSTPLPEREMNTLCTQLDKKQYQNAYKCNDEMIAPMCDKAACKLTKFGPSEASYIEWGAMSIVEYEDNPLFYWEINNKTVVLTAEEVSSARALRLAVLKKTMQQISLLKDEDLTMIFNKAAKKAQRIKVEKSLSKESMLLDYLRQFCKLGSSSSLARKREAVLDNLVYFDETNKNYMFSLKSFLMYLADHNVREFDKTKVVGMFKNTWQHNQNFQKKHNLQYERLRVGNNRPYVWTIAFPDDDNIFDDEKGSNDEQDSK